MVKRLLSEPPLRYTLSSSPEERKNKGEGKEKGEENEMKWRRRKRENKRSGEREKLQGVPEKIVHSDSFTLRRE